ncbi:ABC transporter ATP-binding protein [Flexivirga endophytica]|uniref:ABC transporter ATP-binding protein n=1 Tax=Flexivirga endophytica TaxID=1849103 RepID=A0A916TK58_9MICO|nr:ABC transporter ATP-binding protein [Flexivirga endophytica]GGB48272.1 ABC transporter ATP-binding protein [Flexivirga endophytica]GHB61211.1 ABC transporter ATP-binding protein [Flexivirga endophytica]
MTGLKEDFHSLHLDGLTRRFGGQTALNGLDLTIERGEFIALLGPSGCGKSTALNCVAGLLPLTAGRIMLDDQQVDQLPPEKRGFGMVFQNYALFPHLSVQKNIAFGLQMRKVPRAEIKRRVAEAIDLVQLGPHAKKLPGQMSGGQQQRVAIARAVVLRPPLVLMDEPLSNLDAKLRLEMRTEIRRLHQSLGLTTIYVTHDQEEALSLADRLVVLRGGEVQQVGTPQELHETPTNAHVADFMGYRNLFDGVVERVDGEHATVGLLGTTADGAAAGALATRDRVRVGIRPEDLVIGAPGATDALTLDATVDVVEYQGREFAVEAHLATGEAVHVRTSERPTEGSTIRLTAEAHRILVFPSAAEPDDSGAAGASAPLETAGSPA